LPSRSVQVLLLTVQGAFNAQTHAGVPPVPVPPVELAWQSAQAPPTQEHVPFSPVQVEPEIVQSPPTTQSVAIAPPLPPTPACWHSQVEAAVQMQR
jgi:hypothetical protein